MKTTAQHLVDGKRFMDIRILGCETDGRLGGIGEEGSFRDVLVWCDGRIREVIVQVEIGLVTGITEVPMDYGVEEELLD
jgi:hypothetical protein